MMITKKNGALEMLVAENISAPHCFTTRFGGVSTGHLSSLNLGLSRGDDPKNVEENFRILGEALGYDPMKLVLTRQVHSDIVRKVGREDWGVYMVPGASPECDALITNDPGTAIVVFTADCTPLLFHDPVTGAVGAAHAGWKGTAAAIGPKTVEAMVREFGCDVKNIRAAIGPNIGFCHFETDADVPNAMLEAFGEGVKPFIRSAGEKFFLDLKQINAFALRRIGVEHIEISEDCTMCSPHRFWSHRVTRSQRGAQGAVILCQEVRK